MHTYIHTLTYACIHVYVCIYVYIYICTYGLCGFDSFKKLVADPSEVDRVFFPTVSFVRRNFLLPRVLCQAGFFVTPDLVIAKLNWLGFAALFGL